MDDILTVLVHEGRHQLDKIDGIIPFENPGGSVSVFAEMRGFSSSANFATKNGFSNNHSALNGLWNNPRSLAIELGDQPSYFSQFGGRPSEQALWDAIELFERYGK